MDGMRRRTGKNKYREINPESNKKHRGKAAAVNTIDTQRKRKRP